MNEEGIMDGEDVSTFAPQPAGVALLAPATRRHFQRVYAAQATRSYLYLSLGIGLVAASLPVLLVAVGGYRTHDSISSFYHDAGNPCRDILVGSLCAVGVFLFLFHGLSKAENWLLNVAGAMVIAVALVPSPVGTGYGSALVHRGAAIIFFLLLGVVAVFLSKGRVAEIDDVARRRRFKTAYSTVGLLMVALPLVAAAVPGRLLGGHSVLLAEWAGIWSFAAYWFIKTFEYRVLLGIRWFDRGNRRGAGNGPPASGRKPAREGDGPIGDLAHG